MSDEEKACDYANDAGGYKAPVCSGCGHEICPCCGNWCDCMVDDPDPDYPGERTICPCNCEEHPWKMGDLTVTWESPEVDAWIDAWHKEHGHG